MRTRSTKTKKALLRRGLNIDPTHLGLTGPLETGTLIGGCSSVGEVLSFPGGGGGMSEKVGGPARGPCIPGIAGENMCIHALFLFVFKSNFIKHKKNIVNIL